MASEIKTGAILNYISISLRLATSFLFTPFLLSSLGVEEYGLYMLSGSVIAWLSLTDFGLGATINKYVVTYRAKGESVQQAHFLGQCIMLFFVIALLTLVVGVVCYYKLHSIFPKLNPEHYSTLQILYLLTLANFILAIPLRPLAEIPGAYQKFIIPSIVNMVASLLTVALMVLLLFLGFKSIGLTVLSVGLGLLNILWLLFYTFCCLKVKIVFRKPDMTLYKDMFGFSVWIFLNQIMDLFYWQAGTPILANISGVAAVAVFTVGISFSRYFMTASTAISGVLAPKLMHMVALGAKREDLTWVMIKAGRLQLSIMILMLCGFISFGCDFLHLWVGDTLGDSITTIWLGALLVVVPLIVPLTQNVGIAILQALSIHRGRAIILFYSSIICVVLGSILSFYWGPIGMFLGTGISLWAGQIVMMNIYYARKAGLNIRLFFAKTYQPFLLPGIVLVLLGGLMQSSLSISTWGDFILIAGSYAVCAVILIWVMYLNAEEKRMFIQPIKKILKYE
ncbi:MAG: hypothetical protein IKZ13_00085 [Akkermansia sp.]|nr:hypothetical protein [Akkermansia sp.]